MHKKTISGVSAILFALAFNVGIQANDQSIVDSTLTVGKEATPQESSDFKISKRKPQPKTEPGYDLKSALGETGIKVAICIGIFLIAVLLLSKKKTTGTIPREAIEVLGSIPLANRQNIQLIRFGQKLVLVESSVNGLKPISEITDPAEVNQMLDLIRPRQ